MVLLVTVPVEGVDFMPLALRLARVLPRLKSFYHVSNRRLSDTVGFEEVRRLYGSPSIEEKLGGLTFEIGPQAFFQTNTGAAEALYGKIADLAGIKTESRVLGLYCGSGAIELSLAGTVRQLTGVDSLLENIRSAGRNAALNGITNASFVHGTVETFLDTPSAEPPDVLILDPPRPGLTPKARKNALALDAPKVVYVSCNPEALARDLKSFLVRGYRIETIVPFDFFPHTPHLEALAVLAL
jgi:23S rRNA (uracil-5-)-methyltransferase RumA